MISDKSVIFQIFGSLMKEPLLLSDTKYILTPDNFSNTFEKSIFGAIYNLAMQGAGRITPVDIDGYLANHENIYKHFTQNNGIEYLQDCEEISELSNFDYYYNKFKKYNLLNDLDKNGIDISDIYPKDFFDEKYNEVLDAFERASVQDIFNKVRLKLTKIEAEYQIGSEKKEILAGEGIDELLVKLQAAPDVGAKLQGNIYNTVVRGARRGKYYVRSADSGVGKTRTMISDACGLAFPFRYNQKLQQWEANGGNEKVLYIGTEQEPEEIQTMILAYLTGINEEQILYGFYEQEDEKIIEQAKYIIKKFQDNFKLVQLPDPDIQSIKTEVRQQVLMDDYSCVFYDYIFSSPALMREFKDVRLREDVILMMLSTALKDLAVELDVFIQTSTQVTISENERNGMKTKASIRGAKSIADKADVGCIISNISKEEYLTLQELGSTIGMIPNQVTDIYKLRRGRYNNVRIWSYFDHGTCRRKDLLITDSNMSIIQNFREFNFTIDFENEEIDKMLLELNGLKVEEETGEVSEVDWNDLL